MMTSDMKTNNPLKESLSKLFQTKGSACLKKIGERLDEVFSDKRYTNNNERFHIIDYCKKKSGDYKKKYGLKINEYSYDTQKSFGADRKTIRLIAECLYSEDSNPIGFYAHNQHHLHVDAFAVHQGKIWVFQTYNDTRRLVEDLEREFGSENIYVQKVPTNIEEDNEEVSLYSQIDDISCPAFAMKYLKDSLKDNGSILAKSHIIETEDLENHNHQFILHPYVERFSQSKSHFQSSLELWKKFCHKKQSSETEDLDMKSVSWREKYDKWRMIYYLLKDLDYKELKEVKKQIIHAPETIMSE